MERRVNIFIALFFISTLIFSQKQSGKLLYKVSLNKNISKLKKDKSSVEKIKGLLSKQDDKFYLLSFSSNKSVFKKEKKLKNQKPN